MANKAGDYVQVNKGVYSEDLFFKVVNVKVIYYLTFEGNIIHDYDTDGHHLGHGFYKVS